MDTKSQIVFVPESDHQSGFITLDIAGGHCSQGMCAGFLRGACRSTHAVGVARDCERWVLEFQNQLRITRGVKLFIVLSRMLFPRGKISIVFANLQTESEEGRKGRGVNQYGRSQPPATHWKGPLSHLATRTL